MVTPVKMVHLDLALLLYRLWDTDVLGNQQ